MPEGDSLHRLALKLRPALLTARVTSLLLPRSTQDGARMVGEEIVGTEARGKNLLVHFACELSLHVHLKMNGRVHLIDGQARQTRSDTVALLTTEHHTVRVDAAPVARLLRRKDLPRDIHFRHLGPDLLCPDFPEAEALRRLRNRDARPLGEALMDQSAVAGIGNVWKSELCFQGHLDPFAPVAHHSDDELVELLRRARTQMTEQVHKKRRTMPDPFTPPSFRRRTRERVKLGEDSLFVYERAGAPCYECGERVAMRRQGETHRSTYYCPRCQPERAPQ